MQCNKQLDNILKCRKMKEKRILKIKLKNNTKLKNTENRGRISKQRGNLLQWQVELYTKQITKIQTFRQTL